MTDQAGARSPSRCKRAEHDDEPALVTLAERGVEAEAAARARLAAAYEQFLAAGDPAKKNQAGEELIRAIVASGAIAEDPVR